MPIYIKTQMHWILARFCINDWCIYVYNSMVSPRDIAHATDAVKPYTVILPLCFRHMDHFYKRAMDVNKNLDVKFMTNLPVQESADCGAYVAAFAEYFIDGIEIPPFLDIELYRSRLAYFLYQYGVSKLNGEVQ
ncbi:unnamed protein product, partial [Cuscuta epithymum]